MDVSEICSKRRNAQEVIFTKQGEFFFPIADRRIKTLGGGRDLRTFSLVRRPGAQQRGLQRLHRVPGFPRPHCHFVRPLHG